METEALAAAKAAEKMVMHRMAETLSLGTERRLLRFAEKG